MPFALPRPVARLVLATYRLKFVDAEPGTERPLAIAAPHTSAVDGLLLFALASLAGLQPVALIHHRYFVGPLGALLRWAGAVPVDRTQPGDLVRQMTEIAQAGNGRTVAIAPKGTRTKREYWKSGFYRIAWNAGVPVSLGFVDMRTRTCGFGPSVPLTGDVRADMDVIRAFYEGKTGVRRGNESVPRLRKEPRDVRELLY